MKQLTLGLLVFINIVALGACSKKLTQPRAAKMAQEKVKTLDDGQFVMNIFPITGTLGAWLPQAPEELPVEMRRLLDAGYLKKDVHQISYPNVTGEFEGPSFKASLGLNEVVHFSLRVDNSRPPNISGSFSVVRGYPDSGTFTGSMNRTGVYHVVFAPTQDFSSKRPPSATMSLARGNPDALTGRFERINVD